MVRLWEGSVGPEPTFLRVHLGRMRRPTPTERFCSHVRMPLHIGLADNDPHAQAFRDAEELMAAGQYVAALRLYRTFAAPLTAPVKARARVDGTIKAQLSAADMASVRIADVAACMDQVQIAVLRYGVIREARYHPLRALAEARWADLAWPNVPRTIAMQILEALPDASPDDPIGRRRRLHGAAIALMLGRPRLTLDLIAVELDPPPKPPNAIEDPDAKEPEPLPRDLVHNLKLLQNHALSVVAARALDSRDDTGLVVAVDRYGPVLWRHPRALSLSIEAADAYRRLLLPGMCVELLQLTMKRVPNSARNELLLATLARCYRDHGDTFRSERTLSYLVEAMRSAGSGWLGRREEATISLAATEVALDSERWAIARRWLDRATAFDPNPGVKALNLYVRGRELLALGRPEEATTSLLAAAAMRHWITPLRRAEVVLDAVRQAMARGQLAEAETYLRLLMAEATHRATEREASYRLADVLQRRGQTDKARAVLRDLILREADDTWGRMAQDDLQHFDFEQRRTAIMARMGLAARR
ncbi:MAG: tetratricopeptide repeat protein [Myxococcota bacterium]